MTVKKLKGDNSPRVTMFLFDEMGEKGITRFKDGASLYWRAGGRSALLHTVEGELVPVDEGNPYYDAEMGDMTGVDERSMTRAHDDEWIRAFKAVKQ